MKKRIITSFSISREAKRILEKLTSYGEVSKSYWVDALIKEHGPNKYDEHKEVGR